MKTVRLMAFWLVAGLGFANSAQALDKVVFGEQSAMTAVVSSVGIAKGFFAEQGIELSRVFTQRSTDAIQAALAGKLDFSYSANAPFLAATAQGAPIVAVGLLSHGFSGILVASKANAALKNIGDYRGKRIGLQRGTGITTVFLMAAERQGLKESDFNITNLRVADMPTAMQGGTFDAVLGWEPSMSRIVSMGYGAITITPEEFEKIAGITYTYPLFTTKDLVKRRPDLVQRFVAAWAKSQQFVMSNRPESMAILRQTLGDAVKTTSDAELEQLIYVYNYDRTAFTPADILDLERTRDFMLKTDALPVKLNVTDIVDNSFASKIVRAK